MLHGSAVAAGISDDASIACQRWSVTDGQAEWADHVARTSGI